MAAQVKDPSLAISKPALMTYGFNNHAVRTARWRYIRYADGSEELYDHDKDPNEWNNLASNPVYAQIVREHVEWMPGNNAKAYGRLR